MSPNVDQILPRTFKANNGQHRLFSDLSRFGLDILDGLEGGVTAHDTFVPKPSKKSFGLPLAQRFTDNFTGRSVVPATNGLLNQTSLFARQGYTDFFHISLLS
jgi:hypothetical protein